MPTGSGMYVISPVGVTECRAPDKFTHAGQNSLLGQLNCLANSPSCRVTLKCKGCHGTSCPADDRPRHPEI